MVYLHFTFHPLIPLSSFLNWRYLSLILNWRYCMRHQPKESWHYKSRKLTKYFALKIRANHITWLTCSGDNQAEVWKNLLVSFCGGTTIFKEQDKVNGLKTKSPFHAALKQAGRSLGKMYSLLKVYKRLKLQITRLSSAQNTVSQNLSSFAYKYCYGEKEICLINIWSQLSHWL